MRDDLAGLVQTADILTLLHERIHLVPRRSSAQCVWTERPLASAGKRARRVWGYMYDLLVCFRKRYAEDADHGDPAADMADEFLHARGPAHGGGDRR
eukprot:4999655-Prymnesium_polylepis.1